MDSTDIGDTPLITMSNDTRGSPLISKKPYTLLLKHVKWAQKEVELL